MNILITGSSGFVGRNLITTLKNTTGLDITNIYEYNRESTLEQLEEYCKNANFIFHLAGVNRPKNDTEFTEGNYGFTSILLDKLIKYNNRCPIMIASSIQASLQGQYKDSEYGKSKLMSEELMFDYQAKTGAQVLVYRLPNIFGKWCRPNYNSVIATFCYNIAHDLDIKVNDPSTILELVYIDDLVNVLIEAIKGNISYCSYDGTITITDDKGKYCNVTPKHFVSLKEIVYYLNSFKEYDNSLLMTEALNDSFKKKLYSTYLSYLPKDKVVVPLKMNKDNRGSFTEIIKTISNGQFSVNVSKPGITKGQHWHHSKWELFVVVSGRALIQMRNIITNELYEYEVNGDDLKAVYMLPGYTHNIINLSDTNDLITIMWANEIYDSSKPDTFFMEV